MSGHVHPHRHLSRRQALAVLGGAAAGAPFLGMPHAHAAEDRRPKPIPGGFGAGPAFYHVTGNDHQTAGDRSTPVLECSTITDFDGVISSMHVQGTGTGRDLSTGAEYPLAFDTDMRFMQGLYVAEDGRIHEDTFGFI